jgi:hypothetical protein
MSEEQLALVAAGREGERLNEIIGDILSALREAIDSGKVVFLPRQDSDDKTLESLSGFLSDTGTCDIICIDDRYLNRHGIITDKNGRNVPIASILDVISFLEDQLLINTSERQAILHKLREAGFGLIPVTPDELERFLRSAAFDENNRLRETLNSA